MSAESGKRAPTGVLLIQLGTPQAPRPREVRRYLREFLSDPRVIDLPGPLRWLLLHAVILPTRPRRSAAAYAQIWTEAGSPLLVHGLALRDAVAVALGPDHRVALGMRYGQPSIAAALEELVAAGARRVVSLPLFPQWSEAASGSARAAAADAARALDALEHIEIGAFWDHPGHLEAWRAVADPALERIRPDHVLMSFHGLPERQIRAADASGECLAHASCCAEIEQRNRGCYRAQCFATARALARRLGVEDRYSVAFQSRLGRTPWIGPHTDRALPELRASGVRRLAVLCPAFVADCLETLEEIGIRAREQWLALGGETLELVPSLNASPAWVAAVADLVRGADADHKRLRAASTPDVRLAQTDTPSR
jgi:ferrochelatase